MELRLFHLVISGQVWLRPNLPHIEHKLIVKLKNCFSSPAAFANLPFVGAEHICGTTNPIKCGWTRPAIATVNIDFYDLSWTSGFKKPPMDSHLCNFLFNQVGINFEEWHSGAPDGSHMRPLTRPNFYGTGKTNRIKNEPAFLIVRGGGRVRRGRDLVSITRLTTQAPNWPIQPQRHQYCQFDVTRPKTTRFDLVPFQRATRASRRLRAHEINSPWFGGHDRHDTDESPAPLGAGSGHPQPTDDATRSARRPHQKLCLGSIKGGGNGPPVTSDPHTSVPVFLCPGCRRGLFYKGASSCLGDSHKPL